MSEEFPDIDEIIARLYEAALDDTPWPAVMSDLASTLKLRSASLLIVDHATGGIAFDCSAGLGTRLEDVAEGGEAYRRHYAQLDYRRAHIESLPTGAWSSCHTQFPVEAVSHTEFYNDYVRRWDLRYLTGARVARSAEHSAYIGLMRSTALGPIAGTEHEFLSRLVHHISRALALHLRQRPLREQLQLGLDALNAHDSALFIVRADGSLVFANTAAEMLLGRGHWLRARRGRLVAARPAFAREFAEALRATSASGVASVARLAAAEDPADLASATMFKLVAASERAGLRGDLVLVALQLPAAGPSRRAALYRLYRFSEVEADISEMLVRGLSPAQCAAQRGVSIATVRTQIRSILGKVGTKRVVDLVRVIGRVLDGVGL